MSETPDPKEIEERLLAELEAIRKRHASKEGDHSLEYAKALARLRDFVLDGKLPED